MSGGFSKFKQKTSATKNTLNQLSERFEPVEKAAFESRYIVNQQQQQMDSIHSAFNSVNEIVCGLSNLLMKKGLITEAELDESIKEYAEKKLIDHAVFNMESRGYVVPKDTVEDGVLYYCDVMAKSEQGEVFNGFPREFVFNSSKTYFLTELEQELIGAEIGKTVETKVIVSPDLPDNPLTDSLRNHMVCFSVRILAIRGKSND